VWSELKQATTFFILQNPYCTIWSLLNLSYTFAHGETFDLLGPVTLNPDPYQ
jgi:hypothetical protein